MNSSSTKHVHDIDKCSINVPEWSCQLLGRHLNLRRRVAAARSCYHTSSDGLLAAQG